MIDHLAYKMACRERAKTLSVCTTGAIALAAVAAGYTRSSGSFVADGFAVGMELVASGFSTPANNGAKTITAVSALSIDVKGGATAEASAASRTLAVGLPLSRWFENVDFKAKAGIPYVDEQYIPGPSRQVTWGPFGELELTPLYSIGFNLPSDTGELAASAYQKAFLALFAPRTAIALASGDVLRVRSDTGPFPSQLIARDSGFSRTAVTIPLRIRTPNSI